MNIESTLFYLLLSAGGIFTFTAMLLYIFPPKKINYLYGYRTAAAMKSKERWRFAQRFSAITMLQSGLALAAVSAIGLFYSFSETGDTILGFSLIAVAAVFMFARTEQAIKKLP